MSKLTLQNDFTSGIDIHGKVKFYSLSSEWIVAMNAELVSLEIPNGIRKVNCQGNQIKELKLPSSVDFLSCDYGLFDYAESKLREVDIYYGT